ncbi:polysaccharide lyase family 7 protein [Tropicimonas sediminicola]|uniref:Poly(Beta-D-mannuronate) lyase n=1 Tax=Tropicimonas sediminicola TaxID=1031541 RepID=A0A239E9T2_9RHOB|nr:polysaccharide lyase family 7 protein [Tropicimonas sediminicola]SNS41367.1 poly(beta-D-mannuronate) lyase [Tropicimonas sediminicola]
MRRIWLLSSVAFSVLAGAAMAQTLTNPGFESGWGGWTDVDPNKDATSISGDFNSGAKSGKISKETGHFEQAITLYPESEYELKAYVRGPGVIGIEVAGEEHTAASEGDGNTWVPLSVPFTTASDVEGRVFGGWGGAEGRFDDFELVAISGPALAAAEEAAKGPREYTTLPDACEEMSQLRVVSVSAEGDYDKDYAPELAVDHEFIVDSRWSAEGAGREIILDLGMPQTLKELGLAFYKGHERKNFFEMAASPDGKTWQPLIPRTESAGKTTAIERFDFDDTVARYVKVIGFGNESNAWNSIIEIQPYGCGMGMIDSTGDGSDVGAYSNKGLYGLFNDVPPSKNFDLSAWKITVPYDKDGDGKVDEIHEQELTSGWTDPEVFYTDPTTGGMVFRSIPGGTTTSGSSYPRSELREMMRAGDTSISTRNDDGTPNKNGWVFSSAPAEAQEMAGGVDGVMTATLAVNQVTKTGETGKVGRVIIGQIHAKDDEPIRLYYRKLPHNKFGSIYYAHEPVGEDDKWFEMIGTRKDNSDNPADGIALDEIFSYEIKVSGKEIDGAVNPILDVKIIRDDGTEVTSSYDMYESGYNVSDDFMYFKAGAYSQNNTSLPGSRDADQVTFYRLDVQH